MTTNVMDTSKNSSVVPMAIVAVLFFILGFATWLNGSLMPYLSQILQLTPFQGSLILFSLDEFKYLFFIRIKIDRGMETC